MQSKCILFHRNKQKSCSLLVTVVYSVSRCSNGWPFSFMRMRVAKSNPPVNKPTRLMSPKSSGPETDLISEVCCTKLTRHHSKLNSRRRHRNAVFVGYIRATWRGLPARDWILFFFVRRCFLLLVCSSRLHSQESSCGRSFASDYKLSLRAFRIYSCARSTDLMKYVDNCRGHTWFALCVAHCTQVLCGIRPNSYTWV